MLEQKIELLTAAITALLAEIKGTKVTVGGGGAAAAEGKPGRGRPAGSTKKKEETQEESEDDGLDLGDGDGDDLDLGDEEPTLTQEDVVGAFRALKASHGVDACKAVLKAIGESNALNIPEAKFAKAKAEIDKRAKAKK